MNPKILTDIENYLKNYRIEISEDIEGEGRGGSLKDEGTVKAALREDKKLRPHILDVPPRGFGDMVVLDYDMKTKYVVNIKTSIEPPRAPNSGLFNNTLSLDTFLSLSSFIFPSIV